MPVLRLSDCQVELLAPVSVLGEFVDVDEAAVPLFGSLGFPALDDPDDVVPIDENTRRRSVDSGRGGYLE